MLRSFQGTVDFNVSAESGLDSCLNIKIPSLRSAIHVEGDSLVLLDGETFAEISKKFFFKNKERNLIDSISVNISVEDGNVTVYPFVIEFQLSHIHTQIAHTLQTGTEYFGKFR